MWTKRGDTQTATCVAEIVWRCGDRFGPKFEFTQPHISTLKLLDSPKAISSIRCKKRLAASDLSDSLIAMGTVHSSVHGMRMKMKKKHKLLIYNQLVPNDQEQRQNQELQCCSLPVSGVLSVIQCCSGHHSVRGSSPCWLPSPPCTPSPAWPGSP